MCEVCMSWLAEACRDFSLEAVGCVRVVPGLSVVPLPSGMQDH